MTGARLTLVAAAALFLASTAMAQRPVFEPDRFVDPAMRDRSLFLLGVAAGGVSNLSDRYRPTGGNAGFLVITNSLYAGPFQFDYTHTEFAGKDDPPLQRCDCPEPVYFPTPPPRNARPEIPRPARQDTLQFAFYRTSDPSSDTPATLRYRVSLSGEKIDTAVTSLSTGAVEHRSGHDGSLTFDADTHFLLAGHHLWGTLVFGRASRTGTGTDQDRAQNELSYVARLPGWSFGPVLVLPRLTVGHISGWGAGGVNLLNPYLEAYWRHEKTKLNVHLVWSAEGTAGGADGWRTNHHVALFVDRILLVRSFGPTAKQ
jgi:hypothetical protein